MQQLPVATSPVYEYLDAGLVRLGACPPGALAIGWPDLTGGSPAAVDGWQRWLRRAWAIEPFTAAVELSSPVLADRVVALCGQRDPPPRQTRRAVLSVMKYLLRATSRATPFGLFAGVAPLRVRGRAECRVGDDHRVTARVDSCWLAGVVDRLHRCPALRGRLPVVVNDVAFARDGRLVIAGRPGPAGGSTPGGGAEVSVRLGPPVAAVLRHAASPIVLGELRSAVAGEFPTAAGSVVDAMLEGLVGEGFLITTLRPPMTSTDPLGHVIETAAGVGADSIPDTAAVLGELRAVRAALRRSGAAGAATRRALWSAAATRMRGLAASDRPLHADVRVDAEIGVPERVVREAEAAAAALVRLSPLPSGTAEGHDYHRRFLDRYGIGAVVALGELLHPDTGLGYPAGYRDTTLPAPAPGRLDRRDAALLRLAHAAAWRHAREVVLTDDDLADLARPDTDRAGSATPVAPQPHTELRVEVHASTRALLDRGEFRLVVLGASRAAGTLTGRFLDLLDTADRARLSGAYAALPTITAGALRVQVSGPPVNPRAGNIARAPRLPLHQVTVAEHSGSAHHCEHRERCVPLSDIGIGADTSGLYLVSISRRRPIEPTTFSAIELVGSAHPTLRLLCEISASRSAHCAPFTWGAARTLPFLPRLRYRRAILCPARWSVRAEDLPGPEATPGRWATAIRSWREHWDAPDRVLLGEYDRRLRLDLSEPAHQHILRDTLTRRGRVTLLEAAPVDAFGWIEGRAHELVLPLAATQATPHPARPRGLAARPTLDLRTGHLPGASQWLYARLHSHPDRHTTILTAHLPRLLEALAEDPGDEREWWFVRHTDPDHHIRLRIRLRSRHEFAAAAARLGAWADDLRRARLLRSVQLDTYLPETGRYGDGPALRAAEAFFAADSAAALAQLRLTEAPDVVTATSFVDLVTSFTPCPGHGLRWLIHHTPRTIATPPPREARVRAVELARRDGAAELAALPGGERVLAAWATRRERLAAYRAALTHTGATDPDLVLPDLLHLHHARVAGLSLDHERVCLQLARAAALSRTARTEPAA